MSAQQAAATQKRIILEHALRVHAFALAKDRSHLVAGLGQHNDEGELEGEVEVVEGSGSATSGVEGFNVRVLAASCGFSGAPIPNSGHYFGSNAPQAEGKDSRKVKGLQKTPGLKDAKSAVAIQDSKMLGLRSG